jgi:hypothetical protein
MDKLDVREISRSLRSLNRKIDEKQAYFACSLSKDFDKPCVALRCVALRCVALRCVALRCGSRVSEIYP